MTTTEHLVRRIAACGYDVRLASGSPALVKTRDDASLPDGLLAQLKLQRTAVIEFVKLIPPTETVCAACGRTWFCSEAEIVDACRGVAVCDHGGSRKAITDGMGRVQPAMTRCPYKRDERDD